MEKLSLNLFFYFLVLTVVTAHILLVSEEGYESPGDTDDLDSIEWDPGHVLSTEDRRSCFRCIYLDGDVFLAFPKGDLRNVTTECVPYIDMKNVDRRPDIFLVYSFFYSPNQCNASFHYRLFFKYDYEFLEPYGQYSAHSDFPLRPILPNLNSTKLESWKTLGLTFTFHQATRNGTNQETREQNIDQEEQEELVIHDSKIRVVNGTLYWSSEVVVVEETTTFPDNDPFFRPRHDGENYYNYEEETEEDRDI